VGAVKKRKISCPCQESNPGRQTRRPSLYCRGTPALVDLNERAILSVDVRGMSYNGVDWILLTQEMTYWEGEWAFLTMILNFEDKRYWNFLTT
jgi:hypothetical protein